MSKSSKRELDNQLFHGDLIESNHKSSQHTSTVSRKPISKKNTSHTLQESGTQGDSSMESGNNSARSNNKKDEKGGASSAQKMQKHKSSTLMGGPSGKGAGI